MRYRWVVLGAGTFAQTSYSAITVGLAVMAPVLRDELGLSLGQVGALLSAAWIGSVLTLFPWGMAADRYGERVVLTLGLTGSSLFLVGAAEADSFAVLFGALALAGAAGASVNSASGRAVMLWFGQSERGLALGIRQTAIPLGGLVSALALPRLTSAGGSTAGFLFLAGFAFAGAIAGGALVRGREGRPGAVVEPSGNVLRDRRLWRLSVASGLYLYGQVSIMGFGVLFLHDAWGFSNADAALVIAVSQVLAVVLRIGAGRWSDVVGARIAPLRAVGLAVALSLGVVAVFARGPTWLLVPAVVVAGGLSMAWNGLAFTAAAELAGADSSGAAIGFQQAVLAALGVLAPLLFAQTASVASWTAAFGVAALLPLAGWRTLRPLQRI
jgi:sugar phosphate permease